MIPYRRNDWMILFNKRGVEIQECANLLNFPHSVIINCKITINYHALNYTWKAYLSKCQLNKQEVIKTRLFHSRPQSLLSFWPAAGIESSGGNHFEITKEITEFCPSGLTKSASMAHARSPSLGACNYPIFCLAVFTDWSIFSLNLSRIQIP